METETLQGEAGLQVVLDSLPPNHVTWRVFLAYQDAPRRVLVAYLGKARGPFCAMPAWLDISAEEQAEILKVLWEAKGKRDLSIPKRPDSPLPPTEVQIVPAENS